MVNAEKYTQKSLEALREAQNLTIKNGNQQMEQIHLMRALISENDGLIPGLLALAGAVGIALFGAGAIFFDWKLFKYFKEKLEEKK